MAVADPPAALVSTAAAERAARRLAERFPDVTFRRQEGEAVRDLTIVVPASRLVEICTFLRDDPGTEFAMLAWVGGVDLLPRQPRFEVVYHLLSITHAARLALKVLVHEEDARVPTVTGVWPTANWHERETYDFYGITFDGHPDLTRILLPEDWVGWPLRKDSPLGYQEVAFTHNTPGRRLPTPDLTALKPKKVRYRAH
ncbi:MAG: NADH-quinone oxidoreductase subunit C [Candidatus Eisenbacteria bacterium]|uniref:NADH-quinone oxidoreductase subunit C n=1 Tax=Eiseniibacteriota bacterium TaxID=2212470 RepID=A0A9D6QLU2_UNCEI|nr:NADH-quinone oxidoreductase subunit C [Candidatus Eisenbacteria bacterium]MBI3539033.1 NADH-quinone oxidoreductase subunit C [Candidatus Eisenbacteria bacterium]